MEQKNKVKQKYNLIVKEYSNMDFSQIKEHTIQIETNDINFTIEQYCRNRSIAEVKAELILEKKLSK
tara:strand:+ start:418 stop:618 length:201 start_codon:yes stop_codon:yes gene_type:complete